MKKRATKTKAVKRKAKVRCAVPWCRIHGEKDEDADPRFIGDWSRRLSGIEDGTNLAVAGYSARLHDDGELSFGCVRHPLAFWLRPGCIERLVSRHVGRRISDDDFTSIRHDYYVAVLTNLVNLAVVLRGCPLTALKEK